MATKKNNKAPAKPKKKNYLNNKDLLHQVMLSREQDKMTDELANMLQMLCKRYAIVLDRKDQLSTHLTRRTRYSCATYFYSP